MHADSPRVHPLHWGYRSERQDVPAGQDTLHVQVVCVCRPQVCGVGVVQLLSPTVPVGRSEVWIHMSRGKKMTENERATFVELLVMYQTGKGNDHLVTVLVPTDTHAALGRLCNKNTREAMGIGADNSPFHRDATSGW